MRDFITPSKWQEIVDCLDDITMYLRDAKKAFKKQNAEELHNALSNLKDILLPFIQDVWSEIQENQ